MRGFRLLWTTPLVPRRCDEFGSLFTPFFDDWTEDEFRRCIYNPDYILLDPEYEVVRRVMVAPHWRGIWA